MDFPPKEAARLTWRPVCMVWSIWGMWPSEFDFVLPDDAPSPADALPVSLQGPVWMVELNHQHSEAAQGVLTTVAAINCVNAIGGAAGFIRLMDAIGGDQGVDAQGLLGVNGIIVTPHSSGIYQTLIAGAYVEVGAATTAAFLLKAGGGVPDFGRSHATP